LPQGEGDSVRRQSEGAGAWCKRNGVQLDTSRNYLDRGKSAFHGRHRKHGGALAAFMAEVEHGQIPRGSVLVVENLDRLSRENPWDAVPLLCAIVNAGISVVTFSPEVVYERGSNLTALILAISEFGRSHSESDTRSNRMGEVWAQKRKNVRQNGAVMTRKTVAWVEVRDGKMVLIPDRARIVRNIFTLAIQGYGLALIVKELTREKVPTWGSSRFWSKRYIHKILKGRSVLGNYQPVRLGKPDGAAVPDYYPAVVDEGTWFQAQKALERRRDKPGLVGEKVASLFSGLLLDAETGDRLRIAWQTQPVRQGRKTRTHRRILVSAKHMEGAAPMRSFPYDPFEQAVLSLLREINPRDVLGKEPEGESVIVAAELAVKEQRLRQVEAELTGDDGDVPSIMRSLRSLSAECAGLRKRLAEIRARESNPRSVQWAEMLSLLDTAKDEHNRIRLRELLRRNIDEIRVLIIPRRSHRLAAVQVFFTDDGRRDYLIHYQSAGHGRKGSSCASSFKGDIKPRDLDLRRKGDVRALTKTLGTIDIASLVEAMREA
jgi:DNA invertase Pin-like site-specific DNA recombinase